MPDACCCCCCYCHLRGLCQESTENELLFEVGNRHYLAYILHDLCFEKKEKDNRYAAYRTTYRSPW